MRAALLQPRAQRPTQPVPTAKLPQGSPLLLRLSIAMLRRPSPTHCRAPFSSPSPHAPCSRAQTKTRHSSTMSSGSRILGAGTGTAGAATDDTNYRRVRRTTRLPLAKRRSTTRLSLAKRWTAVTSVSNGRLAPGDWLRAAQGAGWSGSRDPRKGVDPPAGAAGPRGPAAPPSGYPFGGLPNALGTLTTRYVRALPRRVTGGVAFRVSPPITTRGKYNTGRNGAKCIGMMRYMGLGW